MTEADLLLRKWWDYRLVPPKEATFLFITAYCEQYVAFKEAQGANPFEGHPMVSFDIYHPEDWRCWRVMNSLRQWADLHGMSYDEFWTEAFGVIRKWGIGDGYPQIFTSAKILTATKEAIDGNTAIRMSKLPFFRAEGWLSTPIQVEYAHYLAQVVAEKYGGVDQAVKAVEIGALDRNFFEEWLKKQEENNHAQNRKQ